MIQVTVPGYGDLTLAHLVLDFNGTLACDGRLIPGVRQGLQVLAERLQIHVLTADTFGGAAAALNGIPCAVSILPDDGQGTGKLAYVEALGPGATASVGNGRNDRLMLKASALGIAVVQDEGAALEALLAADIVCPGIVSALDLLANPNRLVATLRA